jgi:hypothetical protein
MTLKLHVFSSILFFATVPLTSFAHGSVNLELCENKSEKTQGSNICVSGSNNSKALLHFHSDKITEESKIAVFCSSSQSPLNSVELWMPSMGHGSSPVKLSPTKNSCVEISEMEFFMPGDWEVRTSLQNGETFSFPLFID